MVAQTRHMLTVRATISREDGELIAEAHAQQSLQPSKDVRSRRDDSGRAKCSSRRHVAREIAAAEE